MYSSTGEYVGPCRGIAPAPTLSDVKNFVLVFDVKKYAKFEYFWKCTPEMYTHPPHPLQISKYAAVPVAHRFS